MSRKMSLLIKPAQHIYEENKESDPGWLLLMFEQYEKILDRSDDEYEQVQSRQYVIAAVHLLLERGFWDVEHMQPAYTAIHAMGLGA